MNKIILSGNLTKDPELMETASGIKVCRFGIAVKRPHADETDFFNATAWRGTAETIEKYCKKGNKVLVTGHIQNRSYEDNQGVKRTVPDVIVQEVEFLSPKEKQEEPEPAQGKKFVQVDAFDGDSDCPF